MNFDVEVHFTKRGKRDPDSVCYTLQAESAEKAEETACMWAKSHHPRCKHGVVVTKAVSDEEIERRTADAFARL